MKILKCDICGSEKGTYSLKLPVYRMHDGNDGLTVYEHPKVYMKDMDICQECLNKCTNIYDSTIMGYGELTIQQNPELKPKK